MVWESTDFDVARVLLARYAYEGGEDEESCKMTNDAMNQGE